MTTVVQRRNEGGLLALTMAIHGEPVKANRARAMATFLVTSSSSDPLGMSQSDVRVAQVQWSCTSALRLRQARIAAFRAGRFFWLMSAGGRSTVTLTSTQ